MAEKKKHPAPREERPDRMMMIGGREILWSKDWDEPDDYGIDEERSELDGMRVGERVRAIDDIVDVTGYHLADVGSEGIIIGITHPHSGGGMFNTPSRPAQLLVGWDEVDPSSVPDWLVEGV